MTRSDSSKYLAQGATGHDSTNASLLPSSFGWLVRDWGSVVKWRVLVHFLFSLLQSRAETMGFLWLLLWWCGRHCFSEVLWVTGYVGPW